MVLQLKMSGDNTMIDLTQIIEGVTLTKMCSVKIDKDSTDSKSISLKVKFDGVTLNDVFAKAMSSTVVQWQNGPGRNKYDQWKNNGVVEIDFKAPAKAPQIDPETAMVSKLQAMSSEEQAKYLKSMLAKANPTKSN